MYMSHVKLRPAERGGTGALASFLVSNAATVGRSHHLVWSLFGDSEKRDFLYRLTGDTPAKPVLVYSMEKPVDNHALWDIQTQEFGGNLENGMRVAWSLRVNPRVSRANAKHDLVMDSKRGNHDMGWEEAAQKFVPAWLGPRLSSVGLQAPETAMEVEAYNRRQFSHDASRSRQIIVGETDIRGTGIISDVNALRSFLPIGLGGGKAYGCGMLLIRSF